MGVGAAIAKGNQGEKGKIALLVIKVNIKKSKTIKEGMLEVNVVKSGV